MANSYNSLPVIINTDMAGGFKAAQTLQTPGFGIRVEKLMIVANTTTTAGTINIVDPVDSTVLYPPVGVAASATAGTVILSDNMDNGQLQWRDFKVTGVTSAGVTVYLWYRV